jgi:hypothetical protein
MKKFIIERNFPGAGNLTQQELQAMSSLSCHAILRLGNSYHWIQSYITEDKIYCIHIARNEDFLRHHARMGNFPIHMIAEVKTIIDPSNAEPI